MTDTDWDALPPDEARQRLERLEGDLTEARAEHQDRLAAANTFAGLDPALYTERQRAVVRKAHASHDRVQALTVEAERGYRAFVRRDEERKEQ